MGDFNMDRFSPEYMLMTGEQDDARTRPAPIRSTSIRWATACPTAR